MLFEHWSQVPASMWRWKHFTPQEVASKGDGSVLIVPQALDLLEDLRLAMNAPLVVLSAYRDPLHNARVGGAPLSQHKFGKAFDIRLAGHDRDTLINNARACGFTGFGSYKTFVHVDCGPARAWKGE